MILGFNNQDALDEQINSWVNTYPEIYSCEVRTQTVGDWFLIEFQNWDTHSNRAKVLHRTYQGSLKNTTVTFDSTKVKVKNSDWNTVEFWTVIPWGEETKKSDYYFALIEKETLQDVIKECFRTGVFRIDYQVFEEKYLLQIYFAPFYLLETIRLDYNGVVLWRDEHQNFYPWRKSHPLSAHWCKDDIIRFVFGDEIQTVEALEFENLLDEIKWETTQFNQEALTRSAETLDLEISLKLIPNTAYDLPSPCLWFYDESKQEGLEEWVTNLSMDHRDQYLLLASESPVKGYYLKPRVGVSEELVTPPPSTEKFYRMYENEDVYGPYGTKLAPRLPFKEFARVFPTPSGKSMILWEKPEANNETTFTQYFVEDTMYESLSGVVAYVLAKNSANIHRMKKSVKFSDPKIEIFNWEAHGAPSKKKTTTTTVEEEIVGEIEEEVVEEKASKIHYEIDEGTIEFEEQAPDRIQIRISEIREAILADPSDDHLSHWTELGDLETSMSNYREALSCYELALFYSTGSDAENTIKSKILDSWNNSFGGNFETNLNRVYKIDSEDKLIVEDLNILGFNLIANGSDLSDTDKNFYRRMFSIGMENHMKDMNLIRIFNFCMSYMTHIEEDSFLFLKMKDIVLMNLYEKGIYNGSELPMFLASNSFTENFDGQALAKYSSQLANMFSGEEKTDLQNRLYYFLTFGVGNAWQNNAGQTRSCINQSKEIANTTDDKVHAASIAFYEDRCNKIIAGDESIDYGSEAQTAESNLAQAERYKFNKLVTASLILSAEKRVESNQIMFTDFHNLKDEPDSSLLTLIPERIDRLIHDNSSPRERKSYKMKQAFGVVADLLPRLGDRFTFETMNTMYSNYQHLVSVEHKSSVLGKLLSLAYHYNRKDWIEKLYQEFNTLLEDIESGRLKALKELLAPLVDHFPRMLPKRECLEIIRLISEKINDDFESSCIRVFLAKIYDSLNEVELSKKELKASLNSYFGNSIDDKQAKVNLFLFLIDELQNATHELRVWLGDQIIAKINDISDHLSCNDHFSYSKVLAMEYLVTVDRREEEMSQEFKNYLLEFETTWKSKFFEVVEEKEAELN